MTVVTKITDLDTFNKIIHENKPNIVNFSSSWCGPCKAFAPTFERIASLSSITVGFYKVECDTCESDLGDVVDVSAFPTFRLYNGGNVLSEVTGASVERVQSLVSKAQD